MILSHPSFSGTTPCPWYCVICQWQPLGARVHSPEYPLDYDAKSKISYGDEHGVHDAIAAFLWYDIYNGPLLTS